MVDYPKKNCNFWPPAAAVPTRRCSNNQAQSNLNAGYGIELSGPNAIRKRNHTHSFYTGIIGYASGDTTERNKLVKDCVSLIATYGSDRTENPS